MHKGNVLVSSKCPHGCGNYVFIRIPEGYDVANGKCFICGKGIHAHHYDDVIKEWHTQQVERVWNMGDSKWKG